MDQDLRTRLDALLVKQNEMQESLRKLGEEYQRIDQDLHRSTSPPKPSPHDEPPPLPHPAKKFSLSKAAPKPPPTVAPAPANSVKKTPEKKKTINPGEWEINFGKVWLVRIGILFLLTGLIFLSTYAYKNWLFNAGPAVKVVFFMLISLTLTGVGMWLEKWRARFCQYGRVLASGGLAAGYYTIYASHFVPALKLLDSAIIAGILLTLWAGLMLGFAIWKKSRAVAVMAIGLAFYGTVVNPSGGLSLFSALLLSCAGMGLMLRFKWVGIGLGTVIAAYVAHAFWLGGFYPQAASESLRFTYLACYWVLFTAALAMPGAKSMPPKIQRAFCALNNGAAWSLTVFLIPQFTPHAEIGWISIGIGTLLITLSAVARAGKLWHRSLAVVLGHQGILIASLGILLEATGYTRFLVMGVEACILLAGARYFGGSLARGAAVVAFLCAIFTALPENAGGAIPPWPSYAALALVFALYTALVRYDGLPNATKGQGDFVPLLPAGVTWLVAIAGVFTRWDIPAGINGLWLTTTAIMLAYFLLKNPKWILAIQDISMLSIFTALGGAWWYLGAYNGLSIAQSALPLAGAAAFWHHCPKLVRAWDNFSNTPKKPTGKSLEWIFSVLFWLMTAVTVSEHMQGKESWMITGGLLAISGHALAQYTRRPSIGVPAIFFHGIALVTLVQYGNHEAGLGWMPAVLILLHLILADVFWKVLGVKQVRIILAFGLTLAVGAHAFQEFHRPDLTLTALGLPMVAWAYQRKDHTFAVAGGVFPLLIACITTLTIHPSQDWGRYLPIAAILLTHSMLWQGTRTDKNWKGARVLLLTSGLVSLLISSYAHVYNAFEGAGTAICWSLLASLLFCIGLAMRCRPYRLIAFWWLFAAVLHVVFIDVMKLETLGRILSFITLGIVLLGLGFLYNRFQETIRKFL